MQSKFYIFILLILFPRLITAQSFLNGSFENTTSTGCNYNLSNIDFNTQMSDVNAYGAGNEIDIIEVGCYVTSIIDGIHCVALAGVTTDELALSLSTPLVTGTAYTFSFYSYSNTEFTIQGNVEIGASTNNNTFGTLIYTGVTIPDTWVQHSVSFTAASNATHITVRNVAGVTRWNRVDAFSFVTLLPVQMQNFTTVLVDQKVQLDWQTGQEKDSDYFLIERSFDGISWEPLGQVEAAGNSSSLQTYQIWDEQPNLGNNYYRIKEFDYNGNAMISNVSVVDYQISQKESIVVFPNPTNDQVTIGLLVPETANVTIEIYDMTGRKLLEKENRILSKGYHQEQVNLSELNAGVYMLSINSNTLRYGLQKIVKK